MLIFYIKEAIYCILFLLIGIFTIKKGILIHSIYVGLALGLFTYLGGHVNPLTSVVNYIMNKATLKDFLLIIATQFSVALLFYMCIHIFKIKKFLKKLK